jgi:DNA-binding MarR family transcriptional regulator
MSGRRATSPERRLSLLLLVVAANQRLNQLVDRELAAEAVESRDYALLSLVGVRGPVRLTETAAELGMPITTASDGIRRLEGRGHVQRVPNPEDGRSSLFVLSEAGQTVWRQGWPALQRIQAILAHELEDPAAVRTSLEELGAVLDSALTRSPPKP